ncbi:hypothetical protein FH712_07145 [Marinobacter nauticus]|uniref:hypothetical protein n=1 Tax=Marinobacter nauticus TaxID=2743 RepID=UPI00112F9A48|nr:hypothetical protein [Marinobacter nauticus]TPW24807.1 hypothetical protein FH712_07145 [Marinobacter nauticus]
MNRVGAILKIYLVILTSQLASILFVFFHPASAKMGSLTFLYVVNFSFLLPVLLFSMLIVGVLGVSRDALFYSIGNRRISVSLVVAAGMVFLGFLLMAYDRIFIRGIDYTSGLRAARYAWMASGSGSWLSVIGNLLTPISFFSLIFLILLYDRLSFFIKIVSASSIFFGIIGVSALNGGRSIVLIAIVFVLICLCLKSRFSGSKGAGFKFVVVFVLVSAIGYASTIVESSADMGGVSLERLTVLGVNSLFGELKQDGAEVFQCSPVECLSVYLSAYLFHGQWTTQAMYSLPVKPGSYALYPLSTFMERFGVIDEPLSPGVFSDSGAFVSLPGALYYDFGFLGVFLGGLFFGVALGICMTIIARSKRIGIFKLVFLFYFISILILSPVVPAYGFVYLNILFFSFISFGIFLSIFSRGGFKIFKSRF